jgi:hypothetical protein
MKVEELEDLVKVMQSEIITLKEQVRTFQDIEDIKNLQRSYGYYLEHWMAEDILDLFADGDDTVLQVATGKFEGKDAVRRFFHHGRETEIHRAPNPEFLHQVMQLSGIVHVNPDGKTASGRWYGFGANAFPAEDGKFNPGWMDGVYEVNYIKEGSKWKFKKVHWCMIFHAPWVTSFVDPAKRDDTRMDRPDLKNPALRPTGDREETLWPSGFICPFHFSNPVSGRKTV